jgi:ATP-dependent Clp protease ATP-binding subunit ClpB
MTSNIGSQYLLNGINEKGEIEEAARNNVMNELNRHFKPEFLNRVDEVVLFKPLRKAEIIKIIDLALKDIQRRLDDRRITLKVSDRAKQYMADKAYTPIFGARPVKRYMQKFVETEIGKMIIKGDIRDGKNVNIDFQDDSLKITAN